MARVQQRWSGGDPDELTAWTLVRVYHSIGRVFYGALGVHGLTPQQFGVLVHLAHRPGSSQAALARAVLITPQALGVMMRQLVSAGWVDRRPPDGRGHPAVLTISEAGQQILNRVTPGVLSAVGPPSLGLNWEEDRQLNLLLHQVLDHHP